MRTENPEGISSADLLEPRETVDDSELSEAEAFASLEAAWQKQQEASEHVGSEEKLRVAIEATEKTNERLNQYLEALKREKDRWPQK